MVGTPAKNLVGSGKIEVATTRDLARICSRTAEGAIRSEARIMGRRIETAFGRRVIDSIITKRGTTNIVKTTVTNHATDISG